MGPAISVITLAAKVDKRLKCALGCYSRLCKCQITRDGQGLTDDSVASVSSPITMAERD